MKFLCLFHFAPDAFAGATAEDMRRLDDATIEHDQKLRRSGHLLLASPLQDVSTEEIIDRRKPVRLGDVDGPYAEAKEVVGGVVIVEATDMAEALSLFEDDPIAAYCRIQIRPLLETHKHSKTGEGRPEFQST